MRQLFIFLQSQDFDVLIGAIDPIAGLIVPQKVHLQCSAKFILNDEIGAVWGYFFLAENS